jgi:hypothetical protein
LARFVPFTHVVIRPSRPHFTPRLALTMVKDSVVPWKGAFSTSLQNIPSE